MRAKSVADDPAANRRPLASRRLGMVRRLAEALARARVAPNAISLAGIGFALVAGLALLQAGPRGPLRLAAAPWPAAWLVAAAFVQLRLLANLLDGLVALEGGLGSPTGALYNEVPDRVEDTAILAGFGVAAGWPILGLWAALAAIGCAYVRQVGGGLGQPQCFLGPMAKQHRMAAVTAGCLLGFGAAVAGSGLGLPGIVLWIVLLGSLATIARRLRHIAAGLRA
ncbi:MAG: CDP-alcohol phosphatidyltransferase family protein [Amaricoccus sp.]